MYLHDFAESVTSQWGENGIIAKIFEEIGTENETCVEFGAYDLEDLSNVHPLWAEEGWRALLIEGDPEKFDRIEADYRAHEGIENLDIVEGFVRTSGENSLNSYLDRHDVPTDLDLLSIDVDGMDYHIWEALTDHRPRVVVVEYNPTIPPWKHVVGSADGNNVGASLAATLELGKEKGYELVAVTKSNAIFIQRAESHPFEGCNDLEDLYDFKTHGENIRYAGHTYDGEVFFDGPPTHGRRYTFAQQDESSLRTPEDFHFADTPTPWRPIRYFVTYPIRYTLTHPEVKSRLSPVLELVGLKSTIRLLYDRIKNA